GFVHITRGLLGLIKNEAELAGVLGHEVTHVADKHTVNAIRNSKIMDTTTDLATKNASWTKEAIAKAADKLFQHIFEGQWSQKDENDADHGGAIDANRGG